MMENAPIFSLVYTSRRPQDISPVVHKWLSKAANPQRCEVIISVDGDHQPSIDAAKTCAEYQNWGCQVKYVVLKDLPGNCVKGWNLAASLSTGQVLIGLADDFECPEKWDDKLLSLRAGWIYTDCVVHVADGYNPDIFTLVIQTRKRYERFGYFLYCGYESLFSDTEFTAKAKLDNVVLEATHLLFEHKHCDCGKRAKDDVDKEHASKARWTRGQMLYNYRAARGFPIDTGPHAGRYIENASPIAEKYAVYTQAIKDDFCLFEVEKRLFEEGARNFFFAIPDEYWNGDVTPEKDIQEVLAVAQHLRDLGANVRTKVFEVKNFKHFNLPRIGVETCVRNESVAWIRDEGFQHILIVDGDEIWRRGLLSRLDAIVRREFPTSICVGMVPVIGMPGYPVGNAKDRVTIYVRSDIKFRECRSPWGIQREMPEYDVIHFTATRKTMEEVVKKHKDSGHYDDPSYDFEGFIHNVLPNVKPGMQNVHMFKHYQIWPEVRRWTPEELADIPEPIRAHCSTDALPLQNHEQGTGFPVMEMTPLMVTAPSASPGQKFVKANPKKAKRG